ncbi:MAG: hypothetical protein L6R40_003881 [Gallowayella cf. fulva]|nr:MAG: hypothetical protein L6R40_003881 [Xanthomendoza cf. fulva]
MATRRHAPLPVTSISKRQFYLAFYTICRSFATTSSISSSSQFHRSDFTNQPFTGSYEPGGRTSGPLGDAPILGAPALTPKVLKQHLDQYVVGQERAKKVLSVAVYNHYQRIREAQRLEEEEEELMHQRQRREAAYAHPVQDEYPGHQSTISLHPPSTSLGNPPLIDSSPLTLDKANILLLGPSGVGKTLMAKTLARVLAVPFSMSDCTPFTQAGYIGEDAEVCVQRLLAAANYDVAAAERGIICLDEIDKISTAKMSHGKDVGGEGVQQALLKIIEGTTLQIHAKHEKSSSSRSPGSTTASSSYPTNSPLSGGNIPPTSSSSSGNSTSTSSTSKAETYSIRTDNILFIFAGAFVGLHKIILNRIAKGSIGFGSPIRSSASTSSANGKSNNNDSQDHTIHVKPNSPESALFEKHLPFFTDTQSIRELNPLDLLEPTDLQSYGLIPELIGRIPVSAALSALDEDALVRVLTEPKNSRIKQYIQQFALEGIELHFTSSALREIAKSALGMGTGARGLRTVCERLLTETMFEAPGSSIKFVLVTGAVARKECAPFYFARGQGGRFREMVELEEDLGARSGGRGGKGGGEGVGSFEEYREKSRAAGVM